MENSEDEEELEEYGEPKDADKTVTELRSRDSLTNEGNEPSNDCEDGSKEEEVVGEYGSEVKAFAASPGRHVVRRRWIADQFRASGSFVFGITRCTALGMQDGKGGR